MTMAEAEDEKKKTKKKQVEMTEPFIQLEISKMWLSSCSSYTSE